MSKRRERNPVFLVLRSLQRLSRLKRRLLGKTTPHWFKDGTALIGYVNIVGLAPTLLAIAFAPRHFFERLPGYLTSKFTWVKTPLKFLTSSTSSLAVLYLLTVPADIVQGAGLKAEDVAKVFLCVALLSPLLAPLACGFLYFLLRVFSIMPQVKVDRSLRAGFLIPLSPLSYFHVRPKRYFWSIFYYGVYFCIALYAIMFTFEFGMWLIAQLPSPDPGGSTAAVGVFTSSAFLLVALVGYLLLIVPYIELLRASALIPAPGMHRVDAYLVQEALALLTPQVLAKSGRTRRILTNKLVAATDALNQSINRQAHRIAAVPPDKRVAALEKRRRIYTKIIKVDELEQCLDEQADGSPDHAKLLQQIARLRTLAVPARLIADPATVWRTQSGHCEAIGKSPLSARSGHLRTKRGGIAAAPLDGQSCISSSTVLALALARIAKLSAIKSTEYWVWPSTLYFD